MRRLIVRGPRSRRIADKMVYAKLVAMSMRDNDYFPDPIPALDDLDAHIVVAEAAQVAALTGTVGKAAVFRAALSAVLGDLGRLQIIVQHAANAHPTDGHAIIATAGMSEKDARGPGRADFAVRQGKVSGTVILLARSIGRKATYEWHYTIDGKHWTSVEPTHDAETTISGLAAATRYSFRFRARGAEGLGGWSQVITILVV
jgi:hypothetical protein